jgi:hypothetical protein
MFFMQYSNLFVNISKAFFEIACNVLHDDHITMSYNSLVHCTSLDSHDVLDDCDIFNVHFVFFFETNIKAKVVHCNS